MATKTDNPDISAGIACLYIGEYVFTYNPFQGNRVFYQLLLLREP